MRCEKAWKKKSQLPLYEDDRKKDSIHVHKHGSVMYNRNSFHKTVLF